MIKDVPIKYKVLLTLDEASEYAGVSVNRMRKISEDKEHEIVLWVGGRRLIKRKRLEEYIGDNQESISLEEGEFILWQEDQDEKPIKQAVKLMANGEIKIELFLKPEKLKDLMAGITLGGPIGMGEGM